MTTGDKLHTLDIQVEAQMLESVAGYDDNAMTRELAFAVGALDLNDPDSMRWLACLMARRIAETGVEISAGNRNLSEAW